MNKTLKGNASTNGKRVWATPELELLDQTCDAILNGGAAVSDGAGRSAPSS